MFNLPLVLALCAILAPCASIALSSAGSYVRENAVVMTLAGDALLLVICALIDQVLLPKNATPTVASTLISTRPIHNEYHGNSSSQGSAQESLPVAALPSQPSNSLPFESSAVIHSDGKLRYAGLISHSKPPQPRARSQVPNLARKAGGLTRRREARIHQLKQELGELKDYPARFGSLYDEIVYLEGLKEPHRKPEKTGDAGIRVYKPADDLDSGTEMQKLEPVEQAQPDFTAGLAQETGSTSPTTSDCGEAVVYTSGGSEPEESSGGAVAQPSQTATDLWWLCPATLPERVLLRPDEDDDSIAEAMSNASCDESGEEKTTVDQSGSCSELVELMQALSLGKDLLSGGEEGIDPVHPAIAVDGNSGEEISEPADDSGSSGDPVQPVIGSRVSTDAPIEPVGQEFVILRDADMTDAGIVAWDLFEGEICTGEPAQPVIGSQASTDAQIEPVGPGLDVLQDMDTTDAAITARDLFGGEISTGDHAQQANHSRPAFDFAFGNNGLHPFILSKWSPNTSLGVIPQFQQPVDSDGAAEQMDTSNDHTSMPAEPVSHNADMSDAEGGFRCRKCSGRVPGTGYDFDLLCAPCLFDGPSPQASDGDVTWSADSGTENGDSALANDSNMGDGGDEFVCKGCAFSFPQSSNKFGDLCINCCLKPTGSPQDPMKEPYDAPIHSKRSRTMEPEDESDHGGLDDANLDSNPEAKRTRGENSESSNALAKFANDLDPMYPNGEHWPLKIMSGARAEILIRKWVNRSIGSIQSLIDEYYKFKDEDEEQDEDEDEDEEPSTCEAHSKMVAHFRRPDVAKELDAVWNRMKQINAYGQAQYVQDEWDPAKANVMLVYAIRQKYKAVEDDLFALWEEFDDDRPADDLNDIRDEFDYFMKLTRNVPRPSAGALQHCGLR